MRRLPLPSLRTFGLLFWTGLLLGGLALAIWAAQADHFPGDIAVGRWIQANDVPGRDVMNFVRDVGSVPAAAVTIAIVLVALALSGRYRMALATLPLFFGFALTWVLKELVGRPRTSIDYLEQRRDFTSLSFPSGHVMISTLACGLLLYLCWRVPAPLWLRLPIALWALGMLLLTPWVSVSAGVHWPSDVLGGLVWGLLVLLPLLCLLERLRPPPAGGGGSRRGNATVTGAKAPIPLAPPAATRMSAAARPATQRAA